MQVLLYILGPLLVVAAGLDAVWTVFWVDGGSGPLTSRLTTGFWWGLRKVVGKHRHRVLSLAGPLILLATALMWILLLWVGWALLFSAHDHALTDSRDPTPPDFAGRFWYVAYTLFTVGNGDFKPNGSVWQVFSGVMAASGLSIATLAITYLLNVLSAVVQKRSFAGHITGIGDSPEEFVIRAWRGQGFGAVEVQLNALVVQLGTLTHQHLAYPVLHYYHAAKGKHAIAVAVIIVDEALTLMSHGVREDARPDPAVTRSAQSAVESFVETLATAFISPADHAPPPPDLNRLREAGVPTVRDERFAESVRELDDRRKRLLGMVQSDAWRWPPL